jgi:hypothetical protein
LLGPSGEADSGVPLPRGRISRVLWSHFVIEQASVRAFRVGGIWRVYRFFFAVDGSCGISRRRLFQRIGGCVRVPLEAFCRIFWIGIL